MSIVLRTLLATSLAMLAAPAFAQLDTAIVIGSVIDSQEASVPVARVSARNTATGFVRSTLTDVQGTYRLVALPPGPYELQSELQGFTTVIRNGVTVSAGSASIINFTMVPTAVTETVTVTAAEPVVSTTSTSIGVAMSRRELALLPVFGRNYVNLLRLAPTAASNNGSYGFGGSRSRSNQWFLDGFENSEDLAGQDRTAPAIDSIEEVQVIVNGFKAEFGQASGGVVNVITRSGTNAPRGTGFFLFRDHHLVAKDPYAAEKDPFQRVQYGGSLGGPLRRDKIHYFISYDRDDRDLFDRVTQVLPSSTASFAASTLQFLAQNDIPLSILGSGGRVSQSRPEYIDRRKLSARVDQQVSGSHALMLRYMVDDDSEPSGASGTLYDYNGRNLSARQHDAAATHKWLVGSNTLNEAYVHFGKDASRNVPSFPKLPSVSVSGAFDLGGRNHNTSTNYVTQMLDNFSWSLTNRRTGDHVLKAGAQVKLFRSDGYLDTNFRGTYTFPDLQAFIDGRPSRYTANQGDSRLKRPNDIIGFYAQDDWTPMPSLRLNVGVRYDYEDAKNEALRNVNPDGTPGPGISRDRNNVAPRLGLAWSPGNSTRQSLYAGTGIYYDQIILNIIGAARFTPPKVIGIQIDNPSWPDPFAGGTVGVPPTSVSIIDPHLVTPYNWNSQVGYRRELLRDLGFDVAVVFNRGYDHVAVVNTNVGAPGTATLTGAGAARPDPSFTNKSLYTNYGRIWYKGLVANLKKRLGPKFQANVSYTLSKTTNNSFNFSSTLQVPSEPDLSIGPDAQDRRHRLEAHSELLLPWDIQVAVIGEYRTEAPLDVFAGGRDLNGDGITGDWVNERLCVNIRCAGFSYSRGSSRQISTEDANRLRALFGIAPIQRFEANPKLFNVDLTAQKRAHLGRRSVVIRAEAFNAFNIPQRLFTNATSGPVSQNIVSALFGQYTAVDQPRAVQLTLSLEF